MKLLRLLSAGLFGFSLVGSVIVYSAFRASQAVPDFYQAAMQLESDAADEAGDELEHRVLEMQNELQAGEAWELALSENQINGWLAYDLPQKFPKLLPREIKDPRVALGDGHVKLACRIETNKITSILSLNLSAYLTDEPNVVALRISRVRAGRLPVPLGDMLERISSSAQRSGIEVRWGQEGGDPVALVTLPSKNPELKEGVLLEALEINNEEVRVAGMAGVDQTSRVAGSSDTHNHQR